MKFLHSLKFSLLLCSWRRLKTIYRQFWFVTIIDVQVCQSEYILWTRVMYIRWSKCKIDMQNTIFWAYSEISCLVGNCKLFFSHLFFFCEIIKKTTLLWTWITGTTDVNFFHFAVVDYIFFQVQGAWVWWLFISFLNRYYWKKILFLFVFFFILWLRYILVEVYTLNPCLSQPVLINVQNQTFKSLPFI